MKKSFWNRTIEILSAVLLIASQPVSAAPAPPRHFPSQQDFCRGGKQIRAFSVFFEKKIPRSNPGVPLDRALELEQQEVERIGGEARRYLVSESPEALSILTDQYTLLLPETVRDHYGLGTLIGFSDMSAALRYRRILWKQYVETFTSVREAPSKDPYSLRFEVSLDLTLFCRYGQKTSDLVTQW
ncbi:MAG: hypothetical protein ACXWP5_00870 [Bdellovibrionota bacterium]